MNRFLLVLLLASACGPADDSPRLPMGIDIKGLTASEVGAVQITVLANAKSYLCGDLTASCLRAKVAKPDGTFIPDLVRIKDDAGKEHDALRYEVTDGTQLLTPSGQTFEVHMPEGTNFMVVVEILSPDWRLLANGCGVVAQVSKGDDPTPVTPVPTCEPRID